MLRKVPSLVKKRRVHSALFPLGPQAMRKGDRYVKLVEWSDEDACFIGSCPELFYGGCHGADPRAVFDLRLRGTGELALSLSRAHTLFLDLKRAGVIEEEES